MDTLILERADVRRLLPMAECMDVMAETLAALARGEALQPLRSVMWLPDERGALAVMPSYLPNAGMGAKVITVFPQNRQAGYESHQGVVLLFEPQHGQLQAIVDAGEITAIRTAAVSGVATRLLARPDAGDLAILGSGVQADTHLAAMLEARPIRRVRVWSRNPEHARAFAEEARARHGVAVEAMPAAQEAVQGADLICTVTAAGQPVLLGDWLAPGAHINAAGSSRSSTRELDGAAVARSRLYVDRRESALNEAGDYLLARQEGLVDDAHIRGEIGDLLLGRSDGRTAPEQITLFKSLGLAIEDLAAAQHVYRKAVAES